MNSGEIEADDCCEIGSMTGGGSSTLSGECTFVGDSDDGDLEHWRIRSGGWATPDEPFEMLQGMQETLQYLVKKHGFAKKVCYNGVYAFAEFEDIGRVKVDGVGNVTPWDGVFALADGD